MSALGVSAYFYRLSPADVGLTSSLEAPGGLYLDGPVSALYSALESAFSGPFYAVLEAGGGEAGRGRLHIHVVAHREDGPRHIRRDSERCKGIYDAPGLYRYLAKPPEPYSLEAELDYRAAKALSSTGKVPRTRRHFLGPERLAWAHAYCTNDLTPAPLSTPAPNPPISSPVHARADSIKAQATGRSDSRAVARDTSSAPLSTWELYRRLETAPPRFTPQVAPRIRVLDGINALETRARRVPEAVKYQNPREGRKKLDLRGLENLQIANRAAMFLPLEAPKYQEARPSRAKCETRGPKLLIIARSLGLFAPAPGLEKRAKSPENPPRRENGQQEGRKRLGMANGRGHRLVSLAAPRRPLTWVIERLRSLFRLPKTGNPLEPVAPFPILGRPESRFKPPLEYRPADSRVWSRTPVNAALRYHSGASAPSTERNHHAH